MFGSTLPPSTAGTWPSTRSPSRLPTSARPRANHQPSPCAHRKHCSQRGASPGARRTAGPGSRAGILAGSSRWVHRFAPRCSKLIQSAICDLCILFSSSTSSSSASNLSEWFADNVNSRGKVFSFFWDGSEEKAELISSKNNAFVKFKWLENEDDSFFEIKITVDEITKDVSLIVTDFADEDEVEESKMLWDSQISDLKSVIGSS